MLTELCGNGLFLPKFAYDNSKCTRLNTEEQYSDRNMANDEYVYSYQSVKKSVELLLATIDEMMLILEESVYPVRLCGRWRTRCCCCFTPLFNEVKQLSMFLERKYKGRHLWIPPLSQQI